MKRVFFVSAAALMTVAGFSAFKSQPALNTAWYVAPEVSSHKSALAVADKAIATDFVQTANAAGKPISGIGVGKCQTNSNFVCASLFSTNGSGAPQTYQSSFVTGQFQYPS